MRKSVTHAAVLRAIAARYGVAFNPWANHQRIRIDRERKEQGAKMAQCLISAGYPIGNLFTETFGHAITQR